MKISERLKRSNLINRKFAFKTLKFVYGQRIRQKIKEGEFLNRHEIVFETIKDDPVVERIYYLILNFGVKI